MERELQREELRKLEEEEERVKEEEAEKKRQKRLEEALQRRKAKEAQQDINPTRPLIHGPQFSVCSWNASSRTDTPTTGTLTARNIAIYHPSKALLNPKQGGYVRRMTTMAKIPTCKLS